MKSVRESGARLLFLTEDYNAGKARLLSIPASTSVSDQVSVYPGPLYRGMGSVMPNGAAARQYIERVQRRLVELNYTEVGEVDGIFGPKTESAVKDFQSVNGLQVDGIVGQATWERLFGAKAIAHP